MAMDCSTRLGTLDEHLLCSWPTVRFFMESTMFGDHRKTSSESARISMLRGYLLFGTRSQSHIPKNTLKNSWKRSLTSTAINKRISMISLRWKRCGGEQARETLRKVHHGISICLPLSTLRFCVYIDIQPLHNQQNIGPCLSDMVSPSLTVQSVWSWKATVQPSVTARDGLKW